MLRCFEAAQRKALWQNGLHKWLKKAVSLRRRVTARLKANFAMPMENHGEPYTSTTTLDPDISAFWWSTVSGERAYRKSSGKAARAT